MKISSCSFSFPDVPASNIFHDDIIYLACRGAVGGYPDGFRPNANASRGQFAKIAALTFALPIYVPATATFTDVPVGSTFYPYVETAYHVGILGGYAPNCPAPGVAAPCYLPGNNATRGQVAKIVVRARGYQPYIPWEPSFQDVSHDNVFYQYIET